MLIQKLTRKLFADKSADASLPKGSLAPAQAKAVSVFEKLPPLHKMPLWMGRPTYKIVDQLFSHDREELAEVSNHQLVIDGVAKPMTIRQYQADSTKGTQAGLMYFHGGGCAIGNLDSHDRFCRYIAKQSGMTVFSVDYRLGPEHKFPAAIDDALAAWNWLCEHASSLNIDMDKTGVGGDSAGAYLATLVCQQKVASSRPVQPILMPAFEWLIYPMLDLRGTSDSYQRCTSGMLLTQDLMNFFRDNYLSNESERTNPLASPLLTETLAGLPSTYVLTVGHDPLMNDGLSYKDKLIKQGVDTLHEHFEHQMHGFISFGGICPHAMATIDQAIDRLKGLILPNQNAA